MTMFDAISDLYFVGDGAGSAKNYISFSAILAKVDSKENGVAHNKFARNDSGI